MGYMTPALQVVQARHPRNHLAYLNVSLTIAPRCGTSRCEVSVAGKWQLASRLHLVQIGCRPNVLLSIVQGLTDHSCCAAGNSKNQNQNAEEHLDAGSPTVFVAEMVSALNMKCRDIHWSAWYTILYDKLSQVCRLILWHRIPGLLLFRRQLLSPCLTTHLISVSK